jgi:putative CocE/NonD family hydrolase
MRWLFTLCISLYFCTSLVAQGPGAKDYSPEKYSVRESRGHKTAMRDGVKLSVDVYRPNTDGQHPAILIQTPYSNNGAGLVDRARRFAKRGYVVAISDCRGRFDSDGAWDPFNAKHKTDGYDLVEWLARQAWCDGNVGTMGQSYMGWTQWWTATQAPPSLKAMVPEVAPPDQLYNGPYQNGILVSWTVDWAAAHAGRTAQVVGPGPYGGFAVTRHKDYMELPYLKLCERRGALDAPWFETWIRDNLSTSQYWRGISYQTPESYGRVNVPALNITGWFDANHPGSPMNYTALKKYGATPDARRPRLVIGPWMHAWNTTRKLSGIDFGESAIINWDGYVCRWFDRYLKGQKNGIDEDPPVYVFVMGRNRWHAEKDWPLPQTRWTKYFLHSGGKANSVLGDGTLSTVAPGKEVADTYTHNPADPVPDTFTNGHIDGPVDTRKGAARQDVLVFSTPPLTEEVEVTGPIEARLFAATSARDTDWMVRLIDVHPDGYSALLCDGVMRARCRDPKNRGAFTAARLSEIEPDRVYEYTLAFWRGTGNVFHKGHRICIEVSSSFFPYYLPNPGTGEDNVGLQSRRVTARQRVLHDAEHPSHVVLPIIPAR